MHFKILSVSCLFIFSGCTSYWYQEGKTFDQCYIDLDNCRKEMVQHYEAGTGIYGYGKRYEESCMQERGYRLTKDSGLPLDVKRQDPVVHAGEGYGAAGTIK